jgi:alkanesulfonate monooxygenase SsuD/methylene tetrahydromethanopterin reductase-like flavin-dependent oxidoreductase (luciferase family)
MTLLGAVLLPYIPPEELPPVALAADEAGLDELWLWEDCFRTGGVATAAAALAITRRLRVGIGILPVPLRNVAVTAMEVGTLERLFPGRAIVGLGHGVAEWMAQVGAKPASPVTLMREYATALRALLAGERVTTDGRYVHLDAVALDWPAATPPTLHIGAIGPRTLRLSGEVADGTIMVGGTTPAEVTAARLHIDEGRAAAGRTDPHRVTVYLPVATGPDAVERLRADGANFGADFSKPYGSTGDAATIAAAVKQWGAAGADAVVLQPTVDEPDAAAFVRFVATEVRPLVS